MGRSCNPHVVSNSRPISSSSCETRISTACKSATGDRLRQWLGSHPLGDRRSREQLVAGGLWRLLGRGERPRFAGDYHRLAMERTAPASLRSRQKNSIFSVSQFLLDFCPTEQARWCSQAN